MREHQSVIGQSVGHHIILAVDVVHRPMNPALSKGVTEGDASAKMWPQIGRAACSLPAAKHYQLLAIFTDIEQKSVQSATETPHNFDLLSDSDSDCLSNESSE